MSELEVVPSGWWWNPDVSPHDLDGMLAANHGRLVSLGVRSTSPFRLAAVWIAKTAGEEHSGWTHDLDKQAVKAKLADASKRVVCLAPYVVGGDVRFAVAWVPSTASASGGDPDVDVHTLAGDLEAANARLIGLRSYVIGGKRHHAALWVDNAGANNIPWGWNPDVEVDDVEDLLAGRRPVCLDPYLDNGKLHFGVVWVKNTGAHDKAWRWYYGLSAKTLGTKLEGYCSYVADLQPYADDLACAMYQWPQPDPKGPPLVTVTGSAQLNGQSDSITPFDQAMTVSMTLTNTSSGPVDINGNLLLAESGGYVDIAIPLSVWLGSLDAGQQVVVSTPQDWGAGIATAIVDLRASGTAGEQHLDVVIPIGTSIAPPPPPLGAPTPLFVGLWRDPAEIFTVWHAGKATPWICIAGQLVNTSTFTAQLVSWHAKVTIDGKVVLDTNLDMTLSVDGQAVPVTNGSAWLSELKSYFTFGFPLPGVSTSFGSGTVDITVHHRIDGHCGTSRYHGTAIYLPTTTLPPPFGALPDDRLWILGNAPDHTGGDSHANPGERYVYDIAACRLDGTPYISDKHLSDNSNFYVYGKPIYAVKHGIVVSSDDTNPENDGTTPVPAAQSTQNWILIRHDDGTYAGYYHVRQHKNLVATNDTVSPGQQIGEIGNAGGSSGPHLHFAYSTRDARGFGTVAPIAFKGLKTTAGTHVDVVPGNGNYKL